MNRVSVSSENTGVDVDEALGLKQDFEGSFSRCVEGCCRWWGGWEELFGIWGYTEEYLYTTWRAMFTIRTPRRHDPSSLVLRVCLLAPSSFLRFYSSQQTMCILCAFLSKTYMILITSLAWPNYQKNWHLSYSATLPMLGSNSLALSYLSRLDGVDTSCRIWCIGHHTSLQHHVPPPYRV